MTERDHPPGRLQLPPWLPVYWGFRVGYAHAAVSLAAALAFLPRELSLWWLYVWLSGVMLFCCHFLFEPKRRYLVMWLEFHGCDTDDQAVAWWQTYESLWRERRRKPQ